MHRSPSPLSRPRSHARKRLPLFPILGAMLCALLLAGVQFLLIPHLTSRVFASPASRATTFTLDHVTVHVETPFLPGTFITSQPGASTQVASSGTQAPRSHPYGAIFITAVPFGTQPRSEGVPIAQAGGAQLYRSTLYQYRLREGDHPQAGPVATLFGQQVTGEVSLMLGDTSQDFSSTVVVEWVVEAGQRLWIVRITQEQPHGTVDLTPASSLLNALNSFTLTSTTLTNPTTVNTTVSSNANVLPAQFPYPDWWVKDHPCQSKDRSSPAGSHSLANWHGLDVCGPVNTANNATFGDKSPIPESAWQCVEMVQRYFILAGYLSQTYMADGSQIVEKYPASNMDKISNGTPGRAPQTGDVLSYITYKSDGSVNLAGHTSLVTASNVNSSGNGTITVLQQNAFGTNAAGAVTATYPTATLNVTNWKVTVSGWRATVTGWLDPNESRVSVENPSRVSVAQDVNADLEAVAVGHDGTLYTSVQTAPNGTTWTSWTQIPGSAGMPDRPFLAQNQNGTLVIVARGNNGEIFVNPQTSLDNLKWSGWTDLAPGTSFLSDPVVARDTTDELEIVAVGTDGKLYLNVQTAPNSPTWSGWAVFGNSPQIAGYATLAQNANGTLSIVARGSDGNIYEDTQISPSNLNWSGWAALQAGMPFLPFKSDVSVALDAHGTLEAFAVGNDGNVYSNAQTAANSATWLGWTALTGTPGSGVAGTPVVAQNQNGDLVVLARAKDGTIYQDIQTPVSDQQYWSGWTPLQVGTPAPSFASDPVIASNQNSTLTIFASGSDSNYYSSAQTPPTSSGAGWGNWQVH